MENICLHKPYIFHNIKTFDKILHKLIEEREVELTQNGIHHDDWPDDELIIQLTEYINIINCKSCIVQK